MAGSKIYYSMGEVAEMLNVSHSLLRYWVSQFDVLRPVRNKKGNRLFSPEDVDNLKRIYQYVKVDGMKLRGAKLALKNRRESSDPASDNMELLERLQRLKATLTMVRDLLGSGEGLDSLTDDDEAEQPAPEQSAPEQPAQKPAAAEPVEPAGRPAAESPAKAAGEPAARRLPFYEQTLF